VDGAHGTVPEAKLPDPCVTKFDKPTDKVADSAVGAPVEPRRDVRTTTATGGRGFICTGTSLTRDEELVVGAVTVPEEFMYPDAETVYP